MAIGARAKAAKLKPEEPSYTGRARGEIRRLLNDEYRVAKIEKLIDEVLDLQGLQWAFCPDCRQRVRVEAPDLKGRIDGLIKLFEQGEGKPLDGEQQGTTIVVERPAR